MKPNPTKTPFKLPSGRTIRLTTEEIKSLREQLSPTPPKEKLPPEVKVGWRKFREMAEKWNRDQPRLEPLYIPVPCYVPVYPGPPTTPPYPYFH